MKIAEGFFAVVMLVVAAVLVIINSATLPPTLDGLSQATAIQDSMGLRVVMMAVFDLHTFALIYLIGGRSFKTIPELLKGSFGRVAFGAIAAAWILGSALVVMS
jgi:hypothetical protein